jgi:serine protease Do
MIQRFLLCMVLFSMVIALGASAQPEESKPNSNNDATGETWDWGYGSEEGGGGSSYLGVDIADVSPERLGELKLKEEHGAEVTMVDQDAPAGKAGLHEHDVIVSLNGTAVESAAQLRRMIKETPAGRVVNLGISRDGQPLTLKVQLTDRHKSMSWSPKVHMDMPPLEMPAMPEFEVPQISVVVVHSSLRSGLMMENITAQLGDFFGVKDGKGALVRSVEKGSRGEQAGFRAGDVVVKVNNQPVHDTSDFTRALRASSGALTVTVMRDKREQNLTLTLPEKKDSGVLLEESFDEVESMAETEQAINRAGDEIAHMTPAIVEKVEAETSRCQEQEERLKEQREELRERRQEIEEEREEVRDSQLERQEERQEEMQERVQMKHGMAEI